MVTIVLIGASGCEPPATVTATPSTLTPGCDTITTVTGVGTPAAKVRNAFLEVQAMDGHWSTYNWWMTGAPGEKKGEIHVGVKSDGTYSLTYFRPLAAKPMRFRIRGSVYLTDKDGPVSKSWYVNAPASCS